MNNFQFAYGIFRSQVDKKNSRQLESVNSRQLESEKSRQLESEKSRQLESEKSRIYILEICVLKYLDY